MKLQIVNEAPNMQWVDNYKAVFPEAVWTEKANLFPENRPDVMLHMWCTEDTRAAIARDLPIRHVVFVRRYEMYTGIIKKVDWSKVSDVIMVNDFLAAQFEEQTGKKPHVIYNGVDPSKWTFKERGHGNKIAWVGYLNQKKNLPLALQIMAELPKDYELHIAGEIQDHQVWDYVRYFVPKIRRKVIYNGPIPHRYMDKWLEDKNYILSTAISEGCPNNVIEAMAKGIKPIVHNWPGADKQFNGYADYGRLPNMLFNSVHDALNCIKGRGIPNEYGSFTYRQIAEDRFGLSNYEKVKEIVCQ